MQHLVFLTHLRLCGHIDAIKAEKRNRQELVLVLKAHDSTTCGRLCVRVQHHIPAYRNVRFAGACG